ncbi:MAG: hypothetical protein KAV87_60595 [Desulfobacteraceae bacterium]|nr:hypothetical protein [Desulfobacteraceae bacterium]
MTSPKSLLDVEQAGQQLSSAGMSSREVLRKLELLAKAKSALQQMPVSAGQRCDAFFVPGRVEILGKHTDYAGGRSLVCAVERGFCVLSAAREDAVVRMADAARGECVEFQISESLEPAVGQWSNYPMSVAQRVARNFPGALRGADIAFASDLPADAGISSSSALLIASFLAIGAVNRLAEHPEFKRNIDSMEALASYLGTLENGQTFRTLAGSKGVGTFGGSEDHTAILCGQAGMLSCYSYCPVRLERTIDMPTGFVLAIASSGVVAAKTGAARQKYNRASRLASAVLEVWNHQTGRNDPHLAVVLGASADARDRLRKLLSQTTRGDFTCKELSNRFEHFVAESEKIVPAAVQALAAEDMLEFGREVDRSQKLGEELLGNQMEQTVFLGKCARELSAVAASAFGAGFGGAVWAMIDQDKADAFLKNWQEQYQNTYPDECSRSAFFLSTPGPAAMCLGSPSDHNQLLHL